MWFPLDAHVLKERLSLLRSSIMSRLDKWAVSQFILESLLKIHYICVSESALCTGECVWVADFEMVGFYYFLSSFLKRCFAGSLCKLEMILYSCSYIHTCSFPCISGGLYSIIWWCDGFVNIKMVIMLWSGISVAVPFNDTISLWAWKSCFCFFPLQRIAFLSYCLFCLGFLKIYN